MIKPPFMTVSHSDLGMYEPIKDFNTRPKDDNKARVITVDRFSGIGGITSALKGYKVSLDSEFSCKSDVFIRYFQHAPSADLKLAKPISLRLIKTTKAYTKRADGATVILKMLYSVNEVSIDSIASYMDVIGLTNIASRLKIGNEGWGSLIRLHPEDIEKDRPICLSDIYHMIEFFKINNKTQNTLSPTNYDLPSFPIVHKETQV